MSLTGMPSVIATTSSIQLGVDPFKDGIAWLIVVEDMMAEMVAPVAAAALRALN